MAIAKQNGLSQRQLRFGEEVRHILSTALARQEVFHNVLSRTSVTISEVRMSPDLKHAKTFIIPFGDQNCTELVKALNDVAGELRKCLAKKLHSKFLPKLRFVEDTTYQKAARIEAVFRSPHVAQDLKNESQKEEDVA